MKRKVGRTWNVLEMVMSTLADPIPLTCNNFLRDTDQGDSYYEIRKHFITTKEGLEGSEEDEWIGIRSERLRILSDIGSHQLNRVEHCIEKLPNSILF